MTPLQLITRCEHCDWQGEPSDGCPTCAQNERMTNSAGDLMAQCEGFAETLKLMQRKLEMMRITAPAFHEKINHELRSWRALQSHILGEE